MSTSHTFITHSDMGCSASVPKPTLNDILADLRASGFEQSQMIVAVDMTRSNVRRGGGVHRTFPHNSLHTRDAKNPYEAVMESLCLRLVKLMDDDARVPLLAFGDAASTRHPAQCTFLGDGNLLDTYHRYIADPSIDLYGPTSFAGPIQLAMSQIYESRRFHMLVIVTDGQITDDGETLQAIRDAAKLPIQILIIGVGDGPWDEMKHLDDTLELDRDVVQFVEFTPYMHSIDIPGQMDKFAAECLEELPTLFRNFKRQGKFTDTSERTFPSLPYWSGAVTTTTTSSYPPTTTTTVPYPTAPMHV